jgi:hypothetical protein
VPRVAETTSSVMAALRRDEPSRTLHTNGVISEGSWRESRNKSRNKSRNEWMVAKPSALLAFAFYSEPRNAMLWRK